MPEHIVVSIHSVDEAHNFHVGNYGCSAYKLKDGQDIVWCYTCNGYGADVGEVWMG